MSRADFRRSIVRERDHWLIEATSRKHSSAAQLLQRIQIRYVTSLKQLVTLLALLQQDVLHGPVPSKSPPPALLHAPPIRVVIHGLTNLLTVGLWYCASALAVALSPPALRTFEKYLLPLLASILVASETFVPLALLRNGASLLSVLVMRNLLASLAASLPPCQERVLCRG